MYAKVFASLWDGTLGRQHSAWSVFVFMLANCDAKGVFEQTPEQIAARTGMDISEVEKGLRVLEQADRRSRTPTEDGRRIVRLDEHRDWGWRIVNYGLYRDSRDRDERRRQWRESKQRIRAQHVSTDVHAGPPKSTQAEAEAEAYAEKKKDTHLSPSGDAWDAFFAEFWQEYPHFGRRSSRKRSLERWRRIMPHTPETHAAIMAGLRHAAASDDWTREQGRFVPAAEVWIGKAGWDASDGKNGNGRDPFAEWLARPA